MAASAAAAAGFVRGPLPRARPAAAAPAAASEALAMTDHDVRAVLRMQRPRRLHIYVMMPSRELL